MTCPAAPDDAPSPVRIPITDELDLHTFSPKELVPLLDAYLEECRKKEILNVRIVHGKGTGTLRTCVHSYLARRKNTVLGYRSGDENSGSWGATWVRLAPLDSKDQKFGKQDVS